MAAVITTLDQHNDQQQQIVEVDSARRRAETVHALSSRPQLNIDDVDDDETFNKKPTRLAWSNCSGTAAVNLRLLVLLSGISCCAVPKLRHLTIRSAPGLLVSFPYSRPNCISQAAAVHVRLGGLMAPFV